MQWQRIAEGKAKDKTERLCRYWIALVRVFQRRSCETNYSVAARLLRIGGPQILDVEKLVFSTVSRKASGLCQFDPPYGPSLVEGALGFDEGGGVTAENPHMAVWRLLP